MAFYDIDGDDHINLFLGEGVKISQYGAPGGSFILENDGSGNIKNITESIASELADLGMITDVSFAGLYGDGSNELIVVGEFMASNLF